MDPFHEQKLTEEVIYLHSLWHRQRPLHKNPNHNPSTPLQLSNPTHFKKQKRKPITRATKIQPESDSPRISDVEWPCPDPADSPSLEWPVLKLPPAPATRMPTAEEQARFAATQVQQKALKAAQEFFVDSDSDDEDSGGDDSDEDDFMEEDECEEYEFFSKFFSEDGELRGYYEKNCGGGDFSCLVCGGIGKKVGKKFKGCVALVQHSNGIAKTKKKRAHRAYAQIICKVLGWDIDRLPTSALAKSSECQGNAEVGMEDLAMINENLGSGNVNYGELFLKEILNVVQEEEFEISNVPGMSNDVGDNVMLCESSLKVGDANAPVESIDRGDLSLTDGKAEGVVNCLVRCSESSSFKIGDANMYMDSLDSGDLSVADGKTERVVNRLCKTLAKTVVSEMK